MGSRDGNEPRKGFVRDVVRKAVRKWIGEFPRATEEEEKQAELCKFLRDLEEDLKQ